MQPLDAWDSKTWEASSEELDDPSLPLVTVGILNYNRCEDIRRTLDAITQGTRYPKMEIIVVDNGSTDGSIEMVRSEFPDVRLHEVGWNAGTSSRNWEAQLGSGKYLFSFDDDTFPGTPSTILRMVRYMESQPSADVLVGTYYQPLSGFDETGEDSKFYYGGNASVGYEGIFLAEGGTCFRVSSLRKVEGYDPRIICYREGYDLALQLYKSGFCIRFCPWFATLHMKSPIMRSSGRFEFLNARHPVWIIGKHWPLPFIPPLLLLWFMRRVLGAILHPKTALPNLKGVTIGLLRIGPFLKYRPKLTIRQAVNLKRFYLQLFRW